MQNSIPTTPAMLLSLALLTGCAKPAASGNQPPDFQHLAVLPGLAQSPLPALQDELGRLQAEEATPAQLQAALAVIPDELNAAAGLRDLLPEAQRRRALKDIAEIYPRGKFTMASSTLERARDLLDQHADAVARVQTALDRPQYDFQLNHAAGLIADLSILEAAELAHRWLALSCAALLAEGKVVAAEQNMVRMLRLDHALSHEKHLVPRLQASSLRIEALRVLEALVQHPAANEGTAVRLGDLLQAQLEDWPHDAQAWIGDRAQGLHTYEMIRHGYILSLLTEAELAELRQGEGVSATAKAIQKNIDADEHYYLQTMRQIITACNEPYHQRRALLDEIPAYLQEIRNTPDFPIVAAKILLVDLDSGHRRQARERAACEGWALALAAATGSDLPPYETNPQTGLRYTLEQEPGRVLLHHARAGEADETIIAPKWD